MSRIGYSDECDNIELYRHSVECALKGKRGQAFLRRLRDSLDAMPSKRLITNAIRDGSGEVCALGAVDSSAPNTEDYYDSADVLAKHFGIARSMAAEIVYMNDEWFSWRSKTETPEQRWERMRAWVEEQIAKPRSVDAVDPVDGVSNA
jgi:hypothetical protein